MATNFFGSSSKVEKGSAAGWRTFISYQTPGGDTCPWASAGCLSLCLGHSSGHFQAPRGAARRAAAARRERYKELMHNGGIRRAAAAYVDDLPRSPRGGWSRVAIRVNGTSDLPFLADAVATEAAARGIGAVFYDYTKSLRAALAWAHGTSVVHRTFSLSESNREQALAAIRAGVNVAAIVESPAAAAELAARLGAAGIVDGDQDDLRFLDPDQRGIGAGYLIALTPKGKLARHDSTGMTYRLGQWPVTDTALAPAM